MDDYQERFAATGRLYGQQLIHKLQQLHIVVVGIGGVGSWAAEALARNGVGQITLIDHDTISLSNINRQIHSLDNTIGHSKVEVMKERILNYLLHRMLVLHPLPEKIPPHQPLPWHYL